MMGTSKTISLIIPPVYTHSLIGRHSADQSVTNLGVVYITLITMKLPGHLPECHATRFSLPQCCSSRSLLKVFGSSWKLAFFSPTLSISNGPNFQRTFARQNSVSGFGRRRITTQSPPVFGQNCHPVRTAPPQAHGKG